MPIDINFNNDTKYLKNKKYLFEQMNLAEAILEAKKMDIQFY